MTQATIEAHIDAAIMIISREAHRAAKLHGPMRGGHEGKAIIEEELDELWEEVKKFPHQDMTAMQTEATHIGAMAARFIADICLGTRLK